MYRLFGVESWLKSFCWSAEPKFGFHWVYFKILKERHSPVKKSSWYMLVEGIRILQQQYLSQGPILNFSYQDSRNFKSWTLFQRNLADRFMFLIITLFCLCNCIHTVVQRIEKYGRRRTALTLSRDKGLNQGTEGNKDSWRLLTRNSIVAQW